jgi:nucleoside-diphosphate-sugar epimerase
MKTVLITGGAGSLGRRVSMILAQKGNRVRIFDLPEADFSFAEDQDNIQVVAGDLAHRTDLEQACKGIDWAIHLAAVMPPLSEMNRELAQKVNVEGTRFLLNALPAAAPLVFASSVATYGPARQEIVKPDHPQQPVELYGADKLRNEKDIMAAGHPAVILRISGISVPALLEIPRPWFFTLNQKMEYVHLDDVALAVTGCLDNPAVLGQTLQIAGGGDWRMTGEDYSRDVCAAFEMPFRMATYREEIAWSGWYHTDRSQQLLQYQRHTFAGYIDELKALYRAAIGG